MIRHSLAYIWLLAIIGLRKVFVNPFLLDIERCRWKTPTTYIHGDFCYEFSLGAEIYWHDAKTACEHQGGYLATIDSMDVQNFIMDRLIDLGFSHNGLWIGLNDEAEELHWRWADGTPLGSFRYWGSGESNQLLTHYLEDCVHLRYTDGGRWHDSPCDSLGYKYNYICQISLLPTRATTLIRTTTTSTLITETTRGTTTTTQERTQKLSTTPEPEYTETSVSASNMHTSTADVESTSILRVPTETSDNTVRTGESTSWTVPQTASTTTDSETTTLEKLTTTTLSSTTSGPITTATTKKTTTTMKPTTSTTMKLTSNTVMADTTTTTSRPATTKTSTTTPTTMKLTMSTVTTTRATTRQSTTERILDPCARFTCNLDCGILGYVYGANGCPECACSA